MEQSSSWPLRPVVVCSRCLGFAHCRYNGEMLFDPVVDALKPFVDFITPCPEVDIGMGVPRQPIKIVSLGNRKRLVQHGSGSDYTDLMQENTREFLSSVENADGFILKSRSPSCGLIDVKHYSDSGDRTVILGKGSGFFGAQVLSKYQGCAIEDEARLGNPENLENFLGKLFTLAAFRKLDKTGGKNDLAEFHCRNKLLLMSRRGKEVRELDRIAAGQSETGFRESLVLYRTNLQKALQRSATVQSNTSVLEYAFGLLSERLTAGEKECFLNRVDLYSDGRAGLAALLELINSWAIKFDIDYLKNQTIYEPYPVEIRKKLDHSGQKGFLE